MPEALATDLKPYYVYELVDPRSNDVFYVGKGTGQRGNQHEIDAQVPELSTEKSVRINEINNSGASVTVRVIGRYSTEEQAFAVEATLIHWVYGLANLTNIQGGHGCSTIRNNGDNSVLEGIDIPKPERQTNGVYSAAMRNARDVNGTVQFTSEVKKWLEERLDNGFTEPDTSESNKTKIYSYYKNVRLRVGVTHTTKPSLWAALEPLDSTTESKDKFLTICQRNDLYVTKSVNLARLKNYKGTRDLDVLLGDLRQLINMIN